ncbi:MAG: glycosyltransferase, partial [Magnetococcales bacterium]|nr:glycosyltransferase [Magnetococcales bacterium]
MGVYNGEGYLDAAITSIVEQSFTDLEFIILDDSSTDSSPNILKNGPKKND